MKTSHFYRKSIKRWWFILSIFLLVCFTFGISVYAQSPGPIEFKKSIQPLNCLKIALFFTRLNGMRLTRH